jgi:glycosyltransferase involved in cell wall biosynthesis
MIKEPSILAPRVTVAIPTLSRVGYLKLALESVLQQTYNNIEIIVSDNASTDATSEYLSTCFDPRLRLLRHDKTIPMTENWNACVAAATGEYFLLLSDDDLLKPGAIQGLVAGYSTSDPQQRPGVVYCGGEIIDSVGHVVRRFKPSPLKEPARELIEAFFENKRDLWFCGVLLRTSDLLPGFQKNYKVACDAAAWIQSSLRHGYAVFIPDNLVSYRMHSNLSSATQLDVWRSEYKQLCALVVAEDATSASPDPAFRRRFVSLMRKLDRNLIVGRIDASYKTNKGKALLEYGRRFSAFMSPMGVFLLCKSILLLFLSEKTRIQLRKLLRRHPS